MQSFPVVIPAAGIGSRMQAATAKQYLLIGSKTILEHTIELMLAHKNIALVLVVLHPEDTIFTSLAIAKHPKVVSVVGGAERVDSVLQGLLYLQALGKYEQVLVHDAARPCLQKSDLDKLISACSPNKFGILAVPVADTIKQANCGNHNAHTIHKTIDRSLLWQAQTPQFSSLNILILAIEKALAEGAIITDEASALEYSGFEVLLVEGQTSNIKITRPSDLDLAQYYLQARC